MINLFKNSKLIVLLSAVLIFSCSKGNDELNNESLRIVNANALVKEDLIGNWSLSRMQADVPVDLNDDAISNTNLLAETSCFNTMGVIFYADGTFLTNNARLDFNAGATNDKFDCISDRKDQGTWDVMDDKLLMSIVIDGKTYNHEKVLVMTANTFAFEVSKIESNQYVTDPGNTQASEIRILELEYSK